MCRLSCAAHTFCPAFLFTAAPVVTAVQLASSDTALPLTGNGVMVTITGTSFDNVLPSTNTNANGSGVSIGGVNCLPCSAAGLALTPPQCTAGTAETNPRFLLLPFTNDGSGAKTQIQCIAPPVPQITGSAGFKPVVVSVRGTASNNNIVIEYRECACGSMNCISAICAVCNQFEMSMSYHERARRCAPDHFRATCQRL
jgi:hypothetical protein